MTSLLPSLASEDEHDELLSSKDVVSQMFSTRGPVPNPKAELKPLTILEPAIEEIEKRASCNGWDYVRARLEVIEQHQAALKRLKEAAPAVAIEIESKMAKAREYNDAAIALIHATLAELNLG